MEIKRAAHKNGNIDGTCMQALTLTETETETGRVKGPLAFVDICNHQVCPFFGQIYYY